VFLRHCAAHLTKDLLLHVHVASKLRKPYSDCVRPVLLLEENKSTLRRTSCISHFRLRHHPQVTPHHLWISHPHQARDHSLRLARFPRGLDEPRSPRTPVTKTTTRGQAPSSSPMRSSSRLCSTTPIETARLPRHQTLAGLQHHHRECAISWWITGR
jgi:hypothetical protein